MALWRPPRKSKFTLETRIPRGDFRPAEPQISHAYPASQGSVFKRHPSKRKAVWPSPPTSLVPALRISGMSRGEGAVPSNSRPASSAHPHR